MGVFPSVITTPSGVPLGVLNGEGLPLNSSSSCTTDTSSDATSEGSVVDGLKLLSPSPIIGGFWVDGCSSESPEFSGYSLPHQPLLMQSQDLSHPAVKMHERSGQRPLDWANLTQQCSPLGSLVF